MFNCTFDGNAYQEILETKEALHRASPKYTKKINIGITESSLKHVRNHAKSCKQKHRKQQRKLENFKANLPLNYHGKL